MAIDAQIVHTRPAALPLTTYEEHKDFASIMSQAKGLGGMSAPDALLTLARGREIGLAPAASLLSVHIINGKPSLSARAKVAAVMANALCESFEEVSASDTEATYETKRRGAARTQRETFTIAEAERAGLLKNKTWAQYPKAMLRARASSALADRVYPDILLGLATEEIEHDFAEQAGVGFVAPQYAPPVAVAPVAHLEAAARAFDTAGYLLRFENAQSEAEVESIALELANAELTEDDGATLTAAYEAAKLRVQTMSVEQWRAHLLTKDVTFEVANSLFKHWPAFDAAGVGEACVEVAHERLRTLGVPDPAGFLDAMFAKRAA